MGMFSRGYEVAREEEKRQAENRERAGKRLYNFFLKGDKEEATVLFLTEEPINFYAHNVKTFREGKERFDTFACVGDGCTLCEDNKPQFKACWLIYDTRPYEGKDQNGKSVTREGTLRLYIVGTRIFGQLDRMHDRYGLTKYLYNIIRLGTGQTNTSYAIERGDPVRKLTPDRIKNLLPDKLRDMYDGTMDSLYKIVEEQIQMMAPDYKGDGDESETASKEDAAEKERERRRKLIGADDDDESDDEDIKDDKPVESATLRKPLAGGGAKSIFKKGAK